MNNTEALTNLKVGEKGIIREIKGDKVMQQRLYSLGVIPGLTLKVENSSFGPIVIKISSNKLALGRGVASNILVEKSNEQTPL